MPLNSRDIIKHEFIEKSDAKHLRKQIQRIVDRVHEVAEDEVQKRSERLKEIYQRDKDILDIEFAERVQLRISNQVKMRRDSLFAQEAEANQARSKMLADKVVMQMMDGCPEVRDAVRSEESKITQAVLAEQILDNQRRRQQERNEDKEWYTLETQLRQKYDENARQKQIEHQKMLQDYRDQLAQQMDAIRERDEENLCSKKLEKEEMRELINEMRNEQFEMEHREKSGKILEYREDLLKQIEFNRMDCCQKRQKQKDEHLALCRKIQRLEQAEREQLAKKKLDAACDIHEHLSYVRGMKHITKELQRKSNEPIESNIAELCAEHKVDEMVRLKREEAQRYGDILRAQICEQAEIRRCDDLAQRENKILVNYFTETAEDVSREVLQAKQRHYREMLDKQIERDRLENDEKLKQQQQRELPINTCNAKDCIELAKVYVRDGIDHLRPHPNWCIMVSNNSTNWRGCHCPDELEHPCPHLVSGKEKKERKYDFLTLCPKMLHCVSPMPLTVEQTNRAPHQSCECPPGTRRHANLEAAKGIWN